MADLTPADALERLVVYTAMTDAQLAMDCERVIKPLISIAARVLDEGFPQKLAELVMFNTGEITTADCMEAAQAVINYLLEGKE